MLIIRWSNNHDRVLQVDQLISSFGLGNDHVGIILQERQERRDSFQVKKTLFVTNLEHTIFNLILEDWL